MGPGREEQVPPTSVRRLGRAGWAAAAGLLALVAAGGLAGAGEVPPPDPDAEESREAGEKDPSGNQTGVADPVNEVDAENEWDARVAVKAEMREATSAPLGASSTVVDPAQTGGAPSTLVDVVSETPGVSRNGQGGHFQVFSVRGVSRHRVMSLVSGVRIHSARRAGASVSFVDPLLMDSVEVLRGPSTTLHGSGALGGVVQIRPRRFRGGWARAGYDSNGDENHQVAGVGAGPWSFGFARRDAGDAHAPDGTRLNSHFTQYSATVSGEWSRGPLRFALLWVPTLAEDVGKANLDFPGRTTEYPRERHQIVKLSVDSDAGWHLQGWVHGHDLETEVVDTAEARRSQVFNDSFDYGARWEREEELAERVSLRWGLQGVGRHGVDAAEETESLVGPPSVERSRPLDHAREFEAGAFTTVHWARPAADYEAGARLSWQNQKNAGFADEDLVALSGFVGVMHRFAHRVELRGSLSSGLRFPNLSERFFTGTTGAGGIVGNPDLDPERSLNLEVSVRHLGRKSLVSAALFHNEIDDYIEREPVDGETDLLTYRNLTSGTLDGVEVQAILRPAERWDVTVGGHAVRGRDDDGDPLADVPPYQAYARLRHRLGAWSFETRWTHRAAKTDPGSAELRRPAADELRATVAYRLSSHWSIAASGANLLDETYYFAADRKATFAPERSFALHLARRGG